MVKNNIIKTSYNLNIALKKKNKQLIENENNFNDVNNTIKHYKSKINKKDVIGINYWSNQEKKKNMFVLKNFKNYNVIDFQNQTLIKIQNNLKILKENGNKTQLKNKLTEIKKFNFNLNKIIYKFMRINFKKINKNNNKINIRYKNHIIIFLNFKTLKFKATVFKNKCLSTITNGLIFKKMNLNNKRYIKSEKLVFLSLKSIMINFNFFKKYKNIFVNSKGLNKNTFTAVNYLIKKIKTNNINLILINNDKICRNRLFGFKKMKSIKRRLKKKFIKFK